MTSGQDWSPHTKAVERGLTDDEVRARVERGEFNEAPVANSRSFADIVRKNTFTWFNGLIGSLWVIMLVVALIVKNLISFRRYPVFLVVGSNGIQNPAELRF